MSLQSSIDEQRAKEVEEDTENNDEQQIYFRPLRVPVFNDESWTLSVEEWDYLLLRYESENKEAVKRGYDDTRKFLSPPVVEFVFTLCARMELPHEIRYLTLFLFDKYMTLQLAQIHQEVIDNADRDEIWSTALKRFYAQTTLRIVSCLSIAVKSKYYKLTLQIRTQQNILKTMNLSYDEDAIMKSESRVFSLLMFDIETIRNPVFMIETYLCLLLDQHKVITSDMDLEALWEHSILYIDFVHLNLDRIYSKLWKAVHSLSITYGHTRERTWHLESELIVLSISVIMISVHCLYGNEKTQNVADIYLKSVGVDLNEVGMFVQVIREEIIGYEQEPPSVILPNELLGFKKVNSGSVSPGFF